MEPVVLVILLALIEYIVLGARVGIARGKTGVVAPAVTGNEEFERHFRVHYNTLEQLIIFVPAIWFFGQYVHVYWAAGLGAVFLFGRALYAYSYVKDPASRAGGTLISVIPNYILALGALCGVIWHLVNGG